MASEYGFALFSASHSITINILTAAFSVYMGAHLSNKMLSTAVLFLLTSLTVARADEPKPDHSGPFYPYKPSFYGNIAAGGAMSLMFFISLIYMFVGSRKDKWAWVLPLGTASMGIGSLERVYLRDHHVFIIYRASQLLVSCLPVAFLAFNYIVFGRFVTAIQGYNNPKDIPANTSDCKYSPISASKVGMIFVTSDLVTLFIVVTGSALSLSEYSDLAQDGADIFLFGTVLQIVSYGIFSILVFITHGRMFKQDKKRFSIFNLKEPCVQIFALLYISGLCIMLRSFYRLVEVALGTKTKLVFEEIYYLVLDGVPLCLAAGVWILRWPGNLLQRIKESAPAVVLDNSQCEVMQPGAFSIKMDDDAVSLQSLDSIKWHKSKHIKSRSLSSRRLYL